MTRFYAIDDQVLHQKQGPQREASTDREVFTITRCLPIEADGRIRYRIRGRNENFERVVTEEELTRLT